jgi:hypothetical protein
VSYIYIYIYIAQSSDIAWALRPTSGSQSVKWLYTSVAARAVTLIAFFAEFIYSLVN